MRYAAAVLALAIGLASWAPLAHAGENNGGDVCYVNGAARSCVQPAQLTLDVSGDAGSVAGPAPVTTPNANPFYGGDRAN